MREVLFRGKRANNNEWVEGGIIPLDTDSGYVFIAEPFPSASTFPVYDIIKYHTHLIIPETVGQYTGLIDKNGKKIFEGDIILIMFETDGIDGFSGYSWYETAEVVWSEEKNAWIVVFNDGGEEMYLNEYNDVDDVYVIGNIYDEPTIGVEDKECEID